MGAGEPLPTVVDSGHRRRLDLSLELPDGELEAALSGDQFDEILDRIAAHVADHRTTLVFVNTRKLSERVAHQLGERLGEDQVAAHHGSLSRERRQRVEHRLRAGDLRALVATASLELGIDVGPVELVCQIGSPHSIATFLQRVGRANHHRTGVPRGIMYPTTRDELVECAALLAAVGRGRLDALHPPEQPLDILAQQIVAEAAARGDDGVAEDELFGLRRPGPGHTGGSPGRSSRRSSTWSRPASRPGAAGAWPTSIATGSTGGCAAAAAPGWPPSPRAARFPRPATTGC